MEPWKIFSGMYEMVFGSGSALNETNIYQTSFVVGVNGLETSASVISGSARLYEVSGVNRSGSTVFLQVFNLTGAPGPGYRPEFSWPVLSCSEKTYSFRTGKPLALGIQLAWSSNYSSLTASNDAGTFIAEWKR